MESSLVEVECESLNLLPVNSKMDSSFDRMTTGEQDCISDPLFFQLRIIFPSVYHSPFSQIGAVW